MRKVRIEEDIDSDYCVIQVATMLHRTANLAESQNDPKTMMDVVAGWFELHERFVGAEEDSARERKDFGFTSTREYEIVDAVSESEHEPFADDTIEESEDEDDDTTESDS